MNCFEKLNIERTKDKRKIKRAYAALVRKHHPEEEPEEFRKIHDAYEEALSYADGMEAYKEDVAKNAPIKEEPEEEQAGQRQNTNDEKYFAIYQQWKKEKVPDIRIQLLTEIFQSYSAGGYTVDIEEWKKIVAKEEYQEALCSLETQAALYDVIKHWSGVTTEHIRMLREAIQEKEAHAVAAGKKETPRFVPQSRNYEWKKKEQRRHKRLYITLLAIIFLCAILCSIRKPSGTKVERERPKDFDISVPTPMVQTGLYAILYEIDIMKEVNKMGDFFTDYKDFDKASAKYDKMTDEEIKTAYEKEQSGLEKIEKTIEKMIGEDAIASYLDGKGVEKSEFISRLKEDGYTDRIKELIGLYHSACNDMHKELVKARKTSDVLGYNQCYSDYDEKISRSIEALN